jgi:transcriptional regulator with XRE-family HTH domain
MHEGNTDARRIGQNVRAARRSAGKSLAATAGLVGRSKSWLSKVENGKIRLDHRADIANLAEALQVSADYLLGEPAPAIRRGQPTLNLVALQKVLLDAGPAEPPDMPARPIDVLADELAAADTALRNAEPRRVVQLLAAVIGELCVHAAAGAGRDRTRALQLLVRAYGSDGTCVLRQVGETNLAWVAGERAQQAADLLDDPIWRGAAGFGRAHARSSTNKPRALMTTPQLADELEPHIGDDRFAAEVYGMIRLSAALACGVNDDHGAAADHAHEAAQLADRLGESGADAWELFGPANVGVWRTSLAVEAGDAEHALTYAGGVTPQALASRNRRAGLRLERARALAMLDHHHAAARELVNAERLSAPQTHNNPLIRELVADLLPRVGGRDLRGLAWRMHLI